MKNFLKFDFVTLASVIISCIVLLSPAAIYAQDSDDKDIHYLQRILTLKGMYTGPIDGIAGPETNNAIRLYKKQIGWHVTNQISDLLIERLREEEKSISPNTNHKPDQSNSLGNEEKLAALAQELKKTKKDLKNTNERLQKITDDLSNYFITTFYQLIGSLLAIFSVAVTISIVVISYYLRKLQKSIIKLVKKTHEEERIYSRYSISAGVLATVSGHCINLYKDIDISDKKRWPLYDSYLQIGRSMSYHSYKNAEELEKTVAKLSKEEEEKKKEIINWSKNNVLFYITTPFLNKKDVTNKETIRKIYDELKEVYKISNEDTNNNLWWEFKETLLWAEYNMGYDETSNIEKKIQSLVDDRNIPFEWREKAYERYAKHDPRPECNKKVTLSKPRS
jgi:hypothetical protein